ALDAADDYLARTRALIAAEANRLVDRLWDVPGLRPAWPGRDRPVDAPGLPNYLLVSVTDSPLTAPQLHEAMARRGVLIRDCPDYPGLEVGALLTGPGQLVATRGNLRIGVRTPEENDRVLAALEGVMRNER